MNVEVFDSLLDVPLDTPGDDGDDRTVPGAEGIGYIPPPEPPEIALLLGVYTTARYVVPFQGPLKLGSRGRAVIALKRALAHADCYPWLPTVGKVFTPILGKAAERGIRKFSLLAAGVDETKVYTRALHLKLAPYYDPYSIRHLLHDTLDEREREAFLAELMYLYNRRFTIRYSQARPWDGRKPPAALDCSAAGEWAAKWAGLDSLSGYTGWGWGNTDTQIARFRSLGRVRESIQNAAVGDPKFYGRGWDPSHVAYYIGRADGRPRVWSSGSYPFGIYDADYRQDGIAICNLTGR